MASRTRASVMLKKPAPSAAKNRKTTPIEGTARPALVTLTTRNEPRLLWPEPQSRCGSAITVAIPTETNVISRCSRSSGSSWLPPTCGAAGALALGDDELQRVAEVAQEGEVVMPSSRASTG